jgi:hypothetical protein
VNEFSWRDAVSIGMAVVSALLDAAERGCSRDEALRDAAAVLDRRRQIDADVDAAAHGRKAGA